MRRFKETALNIALIVTTVAAVVMVAIRVNEAFFSAKETDSPPARTIAAWRDFAGTGHRIGPLTPDVTIVTFTDFQCPFCRRAAAELRAIRQEFPNDVAIVVRHFPIPGHESATPAAQASACAARQSRFEAYHDLLFASQDSIGRKPWAQFAEEAGVPDLLAFETCLSDPIIADLVKRDQADGKKLGVSGTPTFLVNDLLFPGYPGEGQLTEQVRLALDISER